MLLASLKLSAVASSTNSWDRRAFGLFPVLLRGAVRMAVVAFHSGTGSWLPLLEASRADVSAVFCKRPSPLAKIAEHFGHQMNERQVSE